MRVLIIECGGLRSLKDQAAAILSHSSRHRFEVAWLAVRDSAPCPDLAQSAGRQGAGAVILLLPANPRQVSWLPALADRLPTLPLLAATEANDPEVLFDLELLGLGEVLASPLTAASLLPRLWRLARDEESAPGRGRGARSAPGDGLCRLVGQNPVFSAQIAKIPKIACSDAGVLIRGETGTGKELVARAIHYLSPRAAGPFVPVNCGALPVDLVENELFGHERSAFTGASTAQAGLVEEADGGTLFLDELDCLPLRGQVKLLRFLQGKEYRRLGSTRIKTSDVRVIAATNAEVEAAVESGSLRRDLYYRLNVVDVRLPPLRERPEDIPLLARHFLRRFTVELGRPGMRLEGEALEALLLYDWPGNVRELEHVVQRAVVLADGGGPARRADLGLPLPSPGGQAETFREAKARMVAGFERGYLERLLVAHGGNVSRAARSAGKNRRAFFELIRKHGIEVGRFREPQGVDTRA